MRDELEALFHAFILDKGIDVNTLKQHEPGAGRAGVAYVATYCNVIFANIYYQERTTAHQGAQRVHSHGRPSAGLAQPRSSPQGTHKCAVARLESDTIGGLRDEDAIAKGLATSRKSRLAPAARQQALARTSAIGRGRSRRNTEV